MHDLPTRFDPSLINKLDPQLLEDLSRQGFQVTGYRLELVGYQDDLPGVAKNESPSTWIGEGGPQDRLGVE